MLYSKEWKEGLNLDKPSLKALSFLLRNKELWPKGFKWDYTHCATCAIGLSQQLWSLHINPWEGEDYKSLHVILDIDIDTMDGIFFGGFFSGHFGSAITPERVADKIDEVIEKRKVTNAV